MITSLLPGLRELRAPLAGGYLWLLLVWLAVGDELPTRNEEKPPLVDRLYQLEPVVSQLGFAIVASVAAYVIGSIAIDMQVRLARFSRSVPVDPRIDRTHLAITVVRFTTVSALLAVAVLTVGQLGDQLGPWGLVVALIALSLLWGLLTTMSRSLWVQLTVGRHDDAMQPAATSSSGLQVTPQGKRELEGWLAVSLSSLPEYRHGVITESLNYIDSNRSLLKTRILDISEALHSEVDRPDAEATFRMALWPPLALLVGHLAFAASASWTFAIVVPSILVWQSISLRRHANDALITVLVAREELSTPVVMHVKQSLAENEALRAARMAFQSRDDLEIDRVDLDTADEEYAHSVYVRSKRGAELEVRFDKKFRVIAAVEHHPQSSSSENAQRVADASGRAS